MRRRHWWVLVVPIVWLAGCAGTKPCLVIPAQLELAQNTRDAAQETLNKKVKEMDRWLNAIKQSSARIDRLEEDRDKLREELGVLDSEEAGTVKEEEK